MIGAVPAAGAKRRQDLRHAGLLAGVAAMIAAQPAVAQDGTVEAPLVLDPITVEGTMPRTGGKLGPAIAQETGTATKTDTPIVEIPRSISIETEQEMADKGAQRLEDTFLYAAGVRGGNYGYDTRGNWGSIRGFEQPTEYLDGLRYSTGGYYINSLPEVPLLERVEILKGPAGTLYGSGSVGGMINLQSKLPEEEAFRRLTVEYGSFDRKQTTLDMTGKLDERGRVLGRFVGLLRDSETQVDYGRNDAVAAAPSLTLRPTEDTTVTLLGRYQKNWATPDTQFLSQYGTLVPAPNGGSLPVDTYVGEPGFDRMDSESYALTLGADHRLNDVWSIGGTVRYSESEAHYNHAYWDYNNLPTRYGPGGEIGRTVFTRLGSTEVLVGDVNATAAFDTGPVEHQLLFGTGYDDITYDQDDGYGGAGTIDPFDPVYTGITTPVVIDDTPPVDFRQIGFYVQDQARVLDRVLLTLGARWDRIETDNPGAGFNADDDEITTSAALMYEFDNGISPYVSYAESFIQEDFGLDAAGNTFDPTEGRQYEVGVKYQPPGTPSLFTVALFDIEKSNVLQTDPGNPGFQVQTGEATSQGVELEARVKLGQFEIDANYAYVATDDENGAPLDTIPRHQASAWTTYRPDGWWTGFKAGAGIRYVGDSYGDAGTVRTPSYTLGDAMIGYEAESWDLTLNVRNITDEIYVASTGFATGYYGERRTIVLRLGTNF